MRKQIFVLALVCLGLLTLGGTVSALSDSGAAAVLVYEDGRDAKVYRAQPVTVRQFLYEQGYVLKEGDVVKPGLDTILTNNMRVDVNHAFTVYLHMDGVGDPTPWQITQTTVNMLMLDYKKATRRAFAYDTSLALKPVEPGAVYQLTSIAQSVYDEFKEIPFAVQYQDTDALFVGEERVIQEGKPGRSKKTFTLQLKGGQVIGTEESDWALEYPAENKLIERGTKPKEAPKPIDPAAARLVADISLLNYTKALDMAATAYTADYRSTGKRPGDPGFGVCATGMKAQVGVIAVDPRVIPLHTKLYIEGYGYAIAGDTGGAIKGSIVDLFFDTPAEVAKFGKQRVRVYVLADQETEYFALAK